MHNLNVSLGKSTPAHPHRMVEGETRSEHVRQDRHAAWSRSIITTLRRHGPLLAAELANLLPSSTGLDCRGVKSVLIDLMQEGLVVPMRRGRTAAGFPLRVWRVAEPDEVVARGQLPYQQVRSTRTDRAIC
jgi:predicted ArsR family transcriptional regulator